MPCLPLKPTCTSFFSSLTSFLSLIGCLVGLFLLVSLLIIIGLMRRRNRQRKQDVGDWELEQLRLQKRIDNGLRAPINQ
jgi:hypothetical protein